VRRLALSVLAAFALLRFLSWKREKAAATPAPAAPVAVSEPETDPRAEELRAKLEARDDEEPGPEPGAVPEPDERRASVHERGRRTAEQMRDSGGAN